MGSKQVFVEYFAEQGCDSFGGGATYTAPGPDIFDADHFEVDEYGMTLFKGTERVGWVANARRAQVVESDEEPQDGCGGEVTKAPVGRLTISVPAQDDAGNELVWQL